MVGDGGAHGEGGNVLDLFGGAGDDPLDVLGEPKQRRGSKPRNLVGCTFNQLTVLEEIGQGPKAQLRCSCTCGVVRVLNRAEVQKGRRLSCGCRLAPVIPPGTVFNRWTVGAKVRGSNGWLYECVCSCGTRKTMRAAHIKRGMSKSCGCHAFDVKSLPPGEAMFNRTFDQYKINALKRNIPFALGKDEARALLVSACSYCGGPPTSVRKCNLRTGHFTYSGIDRKDNALGYTPENCMSCCATCNRRKLTLSVGDFHSWIRCILRGPYDPHQMVSLTKGQVQQQRAIYHRSAASRGHTFSLPDETFTYLLQSSCGYCGCPPSNVSRGRKQSYTYGGIDRIDNTVGYEEGNVRPACIQCNWAKSGQPWVEVLSWAARIQAYQQDSTSTK